MTAGELLFPAQRFDGVQFGGLPGGIGPENHADNGGNTDRGHGVQGRENQRKLQQTGQAPGDQHAESEPENPASTGQHDGLERELVEYITAPGAQSFA